MKRILIWDKYDGDATITFLHWPADCVFDNQRFEVIVQTMIGFPPAKVSDSKDQAKDGK